MMDLIGLMEHINGEGQQLLVPPPARAQQQWAQYQCTPLAEELTKFLWARCKERKLYHLVYDRVYCGGVGGPFLGPDDWNVLLEDAVGWLAAVSRRQAAGGENEN